MFIFNDSFDGRPSDRDFARFLDIFREEAVLGTRSRRRQEIHRGRTVCNSQGTMCGECFGYVHDAAWVVFKRYARYVASGQTSKKLRQAVDAYVEALELGEQPRTVLVRTMFASGGKDSEREHATKQGRAARPAKALQDRADFAPLRDQPVMMHIALLVVEFANSNTPLPASILPYDHIAESLATNAAGLGVRSEAVVLEQVPRLTHQTLAIIEAIDPEWSRLNIEGPISERASEFVVGSAIELGALLEVLRSAAA